MSLLNQAQLLYDKSVLALAEKDFVLALVELEALHSLAAELPPSQEQAYQNLESLLNQVLEAKKDLTWQVDFGLFSLYRFKQGFKVTGSKTSRSHTLNDFKK